MDSSEKKAEEILFSLRRAVSEELERKRRLGHYAVFWRDGRVVFEGPDAPDSPEEAIAEIFPHHRQVQEKND